MKVNNAKNLFAMKKILIILIAATLGVVAAAQPGYNYPGRHGNTPRNDRFGYSRGHDRRGPHDSNLYGGLKFGVTASHISEGTGNLGATGVKTGITLGVAAGFTISPFAAFESGLYFVEKGGVAKDTYGKITYDLNYLELPLLLKINIFSSNRAIIQPYVGAYLGYGIGGQIKDYGIKYNASSFNDADFRRGDSGLAFGCGVTWSFLHAGIGYEYGLTDISKDGFGDRRNRALTLSVGIAF